MAAYDPITPQILAHIVTRYGDQPGTAGDRVRFPLRSWDGLARPAGADEEIWFPVMVVDLSMSGLGFLTVKPVAIGEELVVELKVEGLEPQHWLCRVVRVVADEEGLHRCGAEFVGSGPHGWQ